MTKKFIDRADSAAATGFPAPETLCKVLGLVAEPQEAGRAVIEEVGRLSRARCVALRLANADGAAQIMVHPDEQRPLVERPALADFLHELPNLPGPVFWQAADAPTAVARMLAAENLANCLVMPLVDGEMRHGTIVAFDCGCGGSAALMRCIEHLSCLYASILGIEASRRPPAWHSEERQLRVAAQAVDNFGESFYWMDLEGHIIYVNPAAERELGYSAAELRRMRISDIDPNVPPELWGKGGEIERLLLSGGLRNFVSQHRHRDGHLIPVEINSAPFEYDGQLYSLAICRDISARLAAEEALRASEARFAAMFNLTPDPMALTRLCDGVFLEVSRSYTENFGYQRDEVLGHSALPGDLGLWIDAEHRRRWREQMEHDGEVLGFETPLRRKNGTVVTVLISGKIVDMDGERCVIVVLRDITQRKRMEELLHREKAEQAMLIRKLEDAQNQLLQSEKLAAIGQLAAGVAHEINNPMGFIRSNLATLKDYADNLLKLVAAYEDADPLLLEHPEVRERIAQAKHDADLAFLTDDMRSLIAESIDGADRVRRIVQDLKNFSRADAAEWESSDIHDCLESTINVVWNEIKYKAELVRDYGTLPLVDCIPARLNQVFMNLLVNAAQAIAEHGRIAIATRCLDDQVEIAFSDTGHGIPADILPKVFEPFFTTKPLGKGTGLGLSVSYGIIRSHGGRIDVVSQPNVGTTFTIRLPIRRAGEPADDKGESSGTAS